jgi:hypothetical protein
MKLNDVEGKEHYKIKISNELPALNNLMWKSIVILSIGEQ